MYNSAASSPTFSVSGNTASHYFARDIPVSVSASASASASLFTPTRGSPICNANASPSTTATSTANLTRRALTPGPRYLVDSLLSSPEGDRVNDQMTHQQQPQHQHQHQHQHQYQQRQLSAVSLPSRTTCPPGLRSLDIDCVDNNGTGSDRELERLTSSDVRVPSQPGTTAVGLSSTSTSVDYLHRECERNYRYSAYSTAQYSIVWWCEVCTICCDSDFCEVYYDSSSHNIITQYGAVRL